MSEVVTEFIRNLATIIDAIAKVLTPVGVILIGYWAYRSKRQSETNAAILATVSANVNGMSSNLVAATEEAKFATGRLQGRDEERAYAENSLTSEDSPVKVVKPDETEK